MNKVSVTKSIVDSLLYSNEFNGKTFVIKIGGSVIKNESSLRSIMFDIKLLLSVSINVVIVHGGGNFINDSLQKQGIKSKFIEGMRVTSPSDMVIIHDVLSNKVNKKIVNNLQSYNIKSHGVTGSKVPFFFCEPVSKDHMNVGKIVSLNTKIIRIFEEEMSTHGVLKSIPVVSPVGFNEAGEMFNINADHAASFLAKSLQAYKLIYLTDEDGIYDNDKKLLTKLSLSDLHQLVNDQVVTDGMLVKVKTIISSLLNENLNYVHILNGNKKHVLIKELFSKNGVGTLCHAREQGDKLLPSAVEVVV